MQTNRTGEKPSQHKTFESMSPPIGGGKGSPFYEAALLTSGFAATRSPVVLCCFLCWAGGWTRGEGLSPPWGGRVGQAAGL